MTNGKDYVKFPERGEKKEFSEEIKIQNKNKGQKTQTPFSKSYSKFLL